MADLQNPFFTRSTLPYQLPAFANIRDEHYRPAFEQGFAEQLAQVQSITQAESDPTFENTIVPLDVSGQVLRRVSEVFFNRSSADSNRFTNALEEEMAPRLAQHHDAIHLDIVLYRRIKIVHNTMHEAFLDAESRYLVERYFTEFTLAGAGLEDMHKAQLRKYNQELSTLSTRFEKNLLADTNERAVIVDDIGELDGLDVGEISAAAEAAKDRGIEGKFLITLVLPTGHPYLASLTSRTLRERIMKASRSRGTKGDYDNRDIVLRIARLRALRAQLLGFSSHAAMVTADQTAKTPEAVATMLESLAPTAARNAREEQEQLERVTDDQVPLRAADWAYYAEEVRLQRFSVDTASMRPYFEAERVLRDGVFFAATQLYGITFSERTDLVSYHPGARIFEVFNEDDSPLGLYINDLYTRETKRGGAWMNPLISQSTLLGDPTIVVNNLNVPKPADGEPTLLTIDEVETLFHEFGHALHGLFAHVTYPKFSGTSVFRDFVEFPSQVNEMWMLWPEVLENYARHFHTGEPMPDELVESLQAAKTFNEGFATSEYLSAALLDQAWHRLGPDDRVTDVSRFEEQALARVGLNNRLIPPRYSSTYFAHTFSGGYDAGYYSYIWSEVLDADTVEWFQDNGGLTRENGEHFRRKVLGVGGSMDPLEAYRDFRGRDATIEPLLARRGLATE